MAKARRGEGKSKGDIIIVVNVIETKDRVAMVIVVEFEVISFEVRDAVRAFIKFVAMVGIKTADPLDAD